MTDPVADFSGWTINGEPKTWREMFELEQAKRFAADEWHVLVSDLDRCEHGRHEGDDCSGCGGPSVGNPMLPAGTVLGHDLSGNAYIVPERKEKHTIANWREGPDD